ncbi:ubiquitin carboxyl-terminal hydrolase 22/27/51 [Fistulifera solaris]|uniref:Ubiquitin carboxyl-terminal hydrolase 22/27/51 n=1 Tax=Fistulifera solaris TaxID=1519565 RepID=A0A1Z5KKJ5_FISSO|nr:ubiquitin carboxyl-terminal hydrolase 22/27/51 [Fistulifera solaris]|eukprot:GAX26796.1 ubiquitin carboxyl-terminal hydrolase 22/27/51 [Fistulifera solaris]
MNSNQSVSVDSTTKNKRKVILEEEFPDYEVILQRAEASLTQPDTPPQCPHLLECLPYTLSLELAQSTTLPNHWMIQNPVHALHLGTQFQGSEEFRAVRDMPILYGEEQERRTVLQMRGFTDVHHPYTRDWNELHQHERDCEETTTSNKETIALVVPEGTGEHPHRSDDSLPEGSTTTMGPPLPRPAVVEATEMSHTEKVVGVETLPSNPSLSTEPVKLEEAAEQHSPTAVESTHQDPKNLPVDSEILVEPETVKSASVEAKELVETDPPPQVSSTVVEDTPRAEAPEAKTNETPVHTYKTPERLLDENRYWNLHTQESHIEKLRTAFLSKRMGDALSSKKKRKSDSKPMALQYMMAWRDHRPYLHKIHDPAVYQAEQDRARRQTQMWMEQYRQSRLSYWLRKEKPKLTLFGAMEEDVSFSGRMCQECNTDEGLMQCLQCSVAACGPDRLQHMLRHNLESNHNFAVTCDHQAKVYCFECGDFVQHEIFDAEKERIDLSIHLPWLSWKEHPVQRSFDAYRFIHIPDQGIFWRGMYATYPSIVPDAHVRGARACRQRQILFHGEVESLAPEVSGSMRNFAEEQRTLGPKRRYFAPAPVGMFNLGNTCYQSSVLQCLIACPFVQKYFLEDFQHPFATCQEHRSRRSPVCVACAMDRLVLHYFGSARGVNALDLLEAKQGDVIEQQQQRQLGYPLVGSEMLLTTWKCPGLTHLAGYEQRDAHEFLHGFLDGLSKSDNEFHTSIRQALGQSEVDGKVKETGLVKSLFDGSFRSVLICQECRNKRSQTESFMSISLPLSKEVERQPSKLSVESCLKNFTSLETLADPVDCPVCHKKTVTKQQHVIRRLPRLLVLHLKRFDNSRKIEDSVSFPERHLNMGIYLPHWCEARQVDDDDDNDSGGATPDISYDLMGTVNHYGTLTSGHYTASVKVHNQWFAINDQHVSQCEAKQVLENGSTYLLFYFRK